MAIQSQRERHQFIQLDKIEKALGLRDGMTVLDIGAGPGLTSLWFAERLKTLGFGKAQVFATDVLSDRMEFLAGEARKKGLTQLFPVVVKRSGLDEFYRSHQYDLVLLSNVYYDLENPVAYFKELRPFLKPGGQILLVIYNQTPLFIAEDFTDLKGLVGALKANLGNPIARALPKTTLQLLYDTSAQASASLKDVLVGDFNRILMDLNFYKSCLSYNRFLNIKLTPREHELADWLLLGLREEGALAAPADLPASTPPKTLRSVLKLNRLFISALLGKYLAHGGIGVLNPASDINQYTSKYAVIRELGLAGYQFVKEEKLSVYFDAVFFTPIIP